MDFHPVSNALNNFNHSFLDLAHKVHGKLVTHQGDSGDHRVVENWGSTAFKFAAASSSLVITRAISLIRFIENIALAVFNSIPALFNEACKADLKKQLSGAVNFLKDLASPEFYLGSREYDNNLDWISEGRPY